MGVWMSRLTSVIVVLALSGSPAAIVACLASCLETRSAHADTEPASRAHCESASVVADATLATPCTDCRNESPSVVVTASRTDRQAMSALQIAAATEVAALHELATQAPPPAPHVPISPPSPVSATIPLRI